MLGIKLSPNDEARLARHARDVGRGKSVIAREWILERLDRDSIEEELRRSARIIAASTTPEELEELAADCDARFRRMNEEDGGYDWGPNGPPV